MSSANPPFSPFLLAGLAAPPGAHRLVEAALGHATQAVWRAHPVIGERMAAMGPVTFLIDPLDLPYHIILAINEGPPQLTVQPKTATEDDTDASYTATVHGGMGDLMALLNGDADGDALFFSRAIIVEGAMDAVVALRNALDDAGVDLAADTLADFGPFARPLAPVVRHVHRVAAKVDAGFAQVARSLRGPVAKRVDAQGYMMDEIEDRLDRLERANKRKRIS